MIENAVKIIVMIRG